jgi:ABC-type maltose transport system permease subunit
MMSFVKILFALALLLFIGGFGYFALSDTQITQKNVTIDIPLSELPK